MTRQKAFVISLTVTLGPLLAGCAQSPVSGLFKANPERTTTAAREPVVLGSRTAIGTAEPSQRADMGTAAGKEGSVERPAAQPAAEGSKSATGPVQKGAARHQTSGKAAPGTGSAAAPNTVIAEEGDTLLKIASRHRVSVSALMTANKLSSLSVTPGQQLFIPKR
jgi:LysM repeat protein